MKKVKAILEMIMRILHAVLNPKARQCQPGTSKPLHDGYSRDSSLSKRKGDSPGCAGGSAFALQDPYPSPINLLGIGLIIISVLPY